MNKKPKAKTKTDASVNLKFFIKFFRPKTTAKLMPAVLKYEWIFIKATVIYWDLSAVESLPSKQVLAIVINFRLSANP